MRVYVDINGQSAYNEDGQWFCSDSQLEFILNQTRPDFAPEDVNPALTAVNDIVERWDAEITSIWGEKETLRSGVYY